MKLVSVFFSVTFIVLTFSGYAQITVTSADMPSVGDIVIESTVPLSSIDTIEPSLTGANYTWNFCHFPVNNQNVDTFVSVSSTPFAYQFFFNNAFLYPGYDASYAKRGLEFSFNQGGIGISVTDVYDYFKKDASDYKQVGFGANINGIPASIQYDGVDYIYRFPMDYGNIDSSNAAFILEVPTLGFYGQKINRKNEVDGWGQITTPFGSYDVVRIKTTLLITDTIYVTQLGLGTAIPRPTSYVYSWLSKGESTPVMTLATSMVLGTEIITGVSFKDVLGGSQPCVNPTGIGVVKKENSRVYPNPATNTITFLAATNKMVCIYNVSGQKVMQKKLMGNLLDVSNLTNGLYFVKVGELVQRIEILR